MIFCIEKTQYTNTPTAESVSHFDYEAILSEDLSFSKGKQLEINDASDDFWLKGISLVPGGKGNIPKCHVLSVLETLQLLQFVMEEKVSLPILQKLRNISCSNDYTVFIFLKTINDDPILLEALRKDKGEQGKIVCKIFVTDSIFMFYCYSLS